MKILVGCETSGEVRRACRAMGHDAWSCDLLPADDGSPYHIQGDVLGILGDGWDMGIFFPTCTYMTNSGARWLYLPDGSRHEERWTELAKATAFFNALWHAPIAKIALENPIMHIHARRLIAAPYTQIVQPWMFGHGQTKATCLWLKNLPPLRATNTVSGREAYVHNLPPSPDRWKLRSKTYTGIAQAMAHQWCGDIQQRPTMQTEMFAAVLS